MDIDLEKPANVVFIGGTGRCGTNVTKEILSEHQSVATLPFEYRFTLDPQGIVDCYNTLKNSWSPYIAHYKIKELEDLLLGMASKNISDVIFGAIIKKVDSKGTLITNTPYNGWELDKWFPNYSIHVHRMLKRLKELNFRGSWPGEKEFTFRNKMYFTVYPGENEDIFRLFLRSLINDLLNHAGKKLFVEDNTWNMLFAKELKDILPEAKFIHLIRDPRDVVVSMTHQRWAPDELTDVIKYYSSLIEKIIEVRDSLSHDKIIQIKLENLVSNTKEVMQKICSFCEIDPYLVPIKKDLSNSNTGRWKTELNGNQKEQLNLKLEKYCELFDYPTSNENAY